MSSQEADAAFISVTGPYDDETETAEDYRDRLTAAAARGQPLTCANPDRVAQRGDKLITCGGALAELYAILGGEVLMAGKPFAPIYDLSLEEASRLLSRPVDRKRVLCIGDGVMTDVKGAQDQGLDCLFIARGIHGEAAMGADGRLHAPGVEALLEEEQTTCAFAMSDLVW